MVQKYEIAKDCYKRLFLSADQTGRLDFVYITLQLVSAGAEPLAMSSPTGRYSVPGYVFRQ